MLFFSLFDEVTQSVSWLPWNFSTWLLKINHTEKTVSCLLCHNRKNKMHYIKVGRKKKKSFTRRTKNKGAMLANSRKMSVLCKEGLTIKDALMPLSRSGFVFHVQGSELMHIAGMFLQNRNVSSRAQCVKGRPTIFTVGPTWWTLVQRLTEVSVSLWSLCKTKFTPLWNGISRAVFIKQM